MDGWWEAAVLIVVVVVVLVERYRNISAVGREVERHERTLGR